MPTILNAGIQSCLNFLLFFYLASFYLLVFFGFLPVQLIPFLSSKDASSSIFLSSLQLFFTFLYLSSFFTSFSNLLSPNINLPLLSSLFPTHAFKSTSARGRTFVMAFTLTTFPPSFYTTPHFQTIVYNFTVLNAI